MVECGSAGGSLNDTRLVLLEDHLVGLDGDGDWTLLQSSLKLALTLWGNISVALSRDDSLGFLSFATEKSMGLGDVWVLSLGLEWVSLGVRESSVHHTTVAAQVQPGAINE